MKKSFYLHLDSLNVLDELTDEQAGQLFKAIRDWHLSTVESELSTALSPLVKVAFSFFENQFKRDLEKYEKKCETNRINGLKGGRPYKQDNPNKPTGLNGNPKNHDKDKDKDKDKDNKKINKRFKPPSLDELQQYAKANNLSLDCMTFIDYYEGNGWMAGKNKMKCWQATARNWSRREQSRPQKKQYVEDQYPNWEKYANQNGIEARPGESYPEYETRVKRMMRQ